MRGRALLGAVALTAATLTACAPDVPQPAPAPEAATPAPALDAERLERIHAEVQETVDAADAALDPALLEGRVAGPALTQRTAEYALAQASGGEYAPTPLTTQTQVDTVAATVDFPRSVLSVSQVPEGSNLPLLTVLRQEDPRDQYALWAAVELFPGAEVPATATPAVGSATVAPDAGGLVLSPEQTVASFAARLQDPAAEHADQFTEDPFTEGFRNRVAQWDELIEAAGEAGATAAPGPNGLTALATTDGGALVVGDVAWDLVIRKTVPGSTLRMGADIGALMGEDTEVRGTVTGRYLLTVAFYVPAEGAGPIQVLGASQALTEVVRDDEATP